MKAVIRKDAGGPGRLLGWPGPVWLVAGDSPGQSGLGPGSPDSGLGHWPGLSAEQGPAPD